MDNKGQINYNIVFVLLLLFITSCVAIYFAQQTHQYHTNFLVKQLEYYTIGSIIIILVMQFDEEQWKKISWYFYGACLLLLLFLLAAPASIAPETKGAKLWFQIPGIGSVQPSEFMKIGLILAYSSIVSNHNRKYAPRDFNSDLLLIGKLLLATFLPLGLVLKQDLGTSMVMLFILLVILIISGITWKIIVPAFSFVFGIGALFIYFILTNPSLIQKYLPVSEYQFNRIYAWLKPDVYAHTLAFNYFQALQAIGSGMMQGNWRSESKAYVPEKHSDFIFSAIGENFGFIGCSFVICLFMTLIFNIVIVALKTKDMFSAYVCAGVIGMIVFHVFENVGMDIGILPITGIPLPFISYGGSSLLTNMLAIGLILTISYRTKTYFFD